MRAHTEGHEEEGITAFDLATALDHEIDAEMETIVENLLPSGPPMPVSRQSRNHGRQASE